VLIPCHKKGEFLHYRQSYVKDFLFYFSFFLSNDLLPIPWLAYYYRSGLLGSYSMIPPHFGKEDFDHFVENQKRNLRGLYRQPPGAAGAGAR
jgi:hypothetical protein